MPDTGAPWNIPYVESTDLVSGWPSDSLALANAIADGLDAAVLPGIGTNVVSTLKTDVFTTTSTSFVPITGLTATITPTSATSLVLVTFTGQWNARSTSGQDIHLRVDRGGTPIAIGDAAGSRTRASFGTSSGNNDRNAGSFAITVLDNPATTSATTYTLEMRVSTGTGAINSTVEDSDNSARARTVSTATLIEVAA